jgi:Kef-type K+ transport system membrane component KefB
MTEGHGLDASVLVGLALILTVAKLGGELFERWGQPAVLGELAGGILVGNLALAGFTGTEFLRESGVIAALAELGVIILLFGVGLETSLGEMLEVGWSSLLVALLGVAAPFLLGWGVSRFFLPDASPLAHLFVGATLCATSVGITARVLKDVGALRTREARIVMGAAVVDDVLGLMILAVVVGAVEAAAAGGTLSAVAVSLVAGKAVAFLFVALAAGHFLVPRLFRRVGRLKTRGALLAFSLAFCFLLSWLAARAGLAPIVGAFAAGLLLDEVEFADFDLRGTGDLEELLWPVSAVLVPVFFVTMGLRVDLRELARPELLGFAAVLTAAAIIGKQVCSLGVLERGVNRFAVGLGMIPRGEVGLIFAGVGAALVLPAAGGATEPVISRATFGAIVFMVIVTTLVTPPALKRAFARIAAGRGDEAEAAGAATADSSASRGERGEDGGGGV